MPPSKKQKTGENASVATQEQDPESSTPHKENDPKSAPEKESDDEGRTVRPSLLCDSIC